jgi:hypothetical protein
MPEPIIKELGMKTMPYEALPTACLTNISLPAKYEVALIRFQILEKYDFFYKLFPER